MIQAAHPDFADYSAFWWTRDGEDPADPWQGTYTHGWRVVKGVRYEVRFLERSHWGAYKNGTRIGGNFESREAASRAGVDPRQMNYYRGVLLARFTQAEQDRIAFRIESGVPIPQVRREFRLTMRELRKVQMKLGSYPPVFCVVCGRAIPMPEKTGGRQKVCGERCGLIYNPGQQRRRNALRRARAQQ